MSERALIKDLPTNEKNLMRALIQHYVDSRPEFGLVAKGLGVAANSIEELIDAGYLKIVGHTTEKRDLFDDAGLNYTIAPTDQFADMVC